MSVGEEEWEVIAGDLTLTLPQTASYLLTNTSKFNRFFPCLHLTSLTPTPKAPHALTAMSTSSSFLLTSTGTRSETSAVPTFTSRARREVCPADNFVVKIKMFRIPINLHRGVGDRPRIGSC